MIRTHSEQIKFLASIPKWPALISNRKHCVIIRNAIIELWVTIDLADDDTQLSKMYRTLSPMYLQTERQK